MSDNFKVEAMNVDKDHNESIDYFSKFGNTFVKTMAEAFLETAEMK
jgi:hypothetical protein